MHQEIFKDGNTTGCLVESFSKNGSQNPHQIDHIDHNLMDLK